MMKKVGMRLLDLTNTRSESHTIVLVVLENPSQIIANSSAQTSARFKHGRLSYARTRKPKTENVKQAKGKRKRETPCQGPMLRNNW